MKSCRKGDIRFLTVNGIEDFELVYGFDVSNRFPTHIHEKYCIGMIEKGKALLEIGNKAECIERDCIYLINPGEAHKLNPYNDSGFSHIVMCFGNKFYKRFFEEDTKSFFNISVIKDAGISERFVNFAKAVTKQDCDIELLLTEVLGEIYPYCGLPLKKEQTNINLDSIMKVCKYIKENPNAIHSLDDMANMACLSRFHFCRLFKSIVGVSPYEYQIQVRLKKSRSLLLEKIPVTEVALELGFTDQSHFTLFFKKNAGVTPAQFVKNNIRL